MRNNCGTEELEQVLLRFFKKRSRRSEPYQLGTRYLVSGKDAVFDLDGLDFTFENCHVVLTDSGFRISMDEEAPMNLIHLLQIVQDSVGVERQEVLDADAVHFTLKLKDDLFSSLKGKPLTEPNVKRMFQFQLDQRTPLADLASYEIERYGTERVLYQ